MIVTLSLPPQHCKPNVRSHWRAKAKAVAEYRSEARDAAMAAAYEWQLMEPITEAVVTVCAFWPTVRRMDADNLLASMKAAFDGITDAGVWADDRDVTFMPCRQAKDAENPRVEIVVEKNFRIFD
jgi:Holliday junction resolvase RusA-like endonuclease